jgi:hypothetical protein
MLQRRDRDVSEQKLLGELLGADPNDVASVSASSDGVGSEATNRMSAPMFLKLFFMLRLL